MSIRKLLIEEIKLVASNNNFDVSYNEIKFILSRLLKLRYMLKMLFVYKNKLLKDAVDNVILFELDMLHGLNMENSLENC